MTHMRIRNANTHRNPFLSLHISPSPHAPARPRASLTAPQSSSAAVPTLTGIGFSAPPSAVKRGGLSSPWRPPAPAPDTGTQPAGSGASGLEKQAAQPESVTEAAAVAHLKMEPKKPAPAGRDGSDGAAPALTRKAARLRCRANGATWGARRRTG